MILVSELPICDTQIFIKTDPHLHRVEKTATLVNTKHEEKQTRSWISLYSVQFFSSYIEQEQPALRILSHHTYNAHHSGLEGRGSDSMAVNTRL